MDLIDRQEVLAETGKWLNDLLEDDSAVDIRVGIRMVRIYMKQMSAVKPERKKDTIQKFHDYQVEWLLSHYDLELEPQLEEWVVRFLHDTANCYMMEIDREEGDSE